MKIEALKHLEHLESVIYMAGEAGASYVASLIDSFPRILGKSAIFEKVDGAPSLTCGYVDGKFFVSTKSLFAKTPKYSTSEEEIEQNHGNAPGLVVKLKEGLKYLPAVVPNNGMVWQGDFMFGEGDKRVHQFDDGVHILFRPNTITYAVPADSPLGKEIERAKIGIVFHTSYTGQIGDLKIDLAPDVSILRKSADVWTFNNRLPSTSALEFTSEDINLFKQASQAVLSVKGIAESVSDNTQLVGLINVFYNSKVRVGDSLSDANDVVEELKGFIKAWAEKEAGKVAQEKTKQAKIAAGEKLVQFIEENDQPFEALTRAVAITVQAKEAMIDKLDKIAQLKQFYETDSGFEAANPEGFVAVSDDGVVKLVHRLEFSRANLLNTKFK